MYCPICNKKLKDTSSSLGHHLKTHEEYINKLNNEICYLKVRGYSMDEIQDITKSLFSQGYIKKVSKNKQFVNEYKNKFIDELIKKFKSGKSCQELEEDCKFNSNKIRRLMKEKLTQEEFILISNKIKGDKISKTLTKEKEEYEYCCPTCNNKFKSFRKDRIYCSHKCSGVKNGRIWGEKYGQKGGLKSVQSQQRRSKNEILFANMCQEYFKDVKCNEPIFNGWDADVIIEDIKVAVLWNGKWHYEQISKDHKLKQVQNRDKIKLREIAECGYISYVIKDMGRHNEEFVKSEFEKFRAFISSLEKSTN